MKFPRISHGRFILFLVLTLCMITSSGIGFAGEKPAKLDLPEGKQTTLGLYLTAAEAFDKWKSDHENVHVIDVRTPEEYIFIGHAEMAWSIPAFFQTHEWDPENGQFKMAPNPDFVSHVQKMFQSGDTIMVICRSGDRSARSADLLTEAGFTNVFNIIDGTEGDKVTDTASLYLGKRMKNGWKNSGIPWTYNLDPGRVRWPDVP